MLTEMKFPTSSFTKWNADFQLNSCELYNALLIEGNYVSDFELELFHSICSIHLICFCFASFHQMSTIIFDNNVNLSMNFYIW